MSILTVKIPDKNELDKKKLSAYKPTREVKDRLKHILDNYTLAEQIKEKSYTEFNDYSIKERQSLDQRVYNIWRESPSEDPDEQWRCLSEDTEILTLDMDFISTEAGWCQGLRRRRYLVGSDAGDPQGTSKVTSVR